jgi:hypothetical protein
MRKLLFLFLSVLPAAGWSWDGKRQNPSSVLNAPDLEFNAFIQQAVEKISQDSVYSYLQVFESFGIKEPGKDGLLKTRDWIRDRMAAWGYADTEFHDFACSDMTLQNIVCTSSGIDPDRGHFVITGHYDTYQGPGTNDNGSGIAVMLEVARIASRIKFTHTVQFIFFSAEEQGLLGSRAYVKEIVVPENRNIRLVLNIDEVGGVSGLNNTTITCERDETGQAENNAPSSACTDTLAALTGLYTDLQTQIAHAWGSDYMSFEAAGYTITGFYESNESPYIHSPHDIFTNLDLLYVTEVARAAMTAAMYFGRADRSTASSVDGTDYEQATTGKPDLTFQPNPFNSVLYLQYHLPRSGRVKIALFDLLGREMKVICDRYHTAGDYSVYFISEGLASAVYYMHMTVDQYPSLVRRVVLVK